MKLPEHGFRSLTTRLVVALVSGVGLVYLVALLRSYTVARELTEKAAQAEAENVAAGIVGSLERGSKWVERSVGLLVELLAEPGQGEARAAQLVEATLRSNPVLHGLGVVWEPGALAARSERVGLYRFRGREDGLAEADLRLSPHSFWEKDWYKASVTRKGPLWSDVHQDPRGGGRRLVTYSRPLLGPSGSVRGAVVADVDLLFLNETLGGVAPQHGGRLVVLSAQGHVLANSQNKGVIGTDARQVPDAEVAHLVARMLAKQRGLEPFARPDGGKDRVVFAPVAGLDWSLAVVYPEERLFENEAQLGQVAARLVLTGLALLAGVVILLSRRLTQPLRALASSATELGTGNLETQLPPVRSRDEIGALTLAFHAMRDSLRTYIANLKQTTAAKQRLESEVQLARRVQMAMVPAAEAAGPSYELAAALVPAREVGGDLYDHFVSGERVVFMVGDVSGKGVGAALFMARAKTLFETAAARHTSPADVLDDVNRGLCYENEAGMFVTMCCGTLDLASGRLLCAIAGHDAPFVAPRAGAPRQLPFEGGAVLGLIEGAEFPTNEAALGPGDTLVLFSDGVSEAMDPGGQQFTLERIGEALAGHSESAGAARDALLAAVRTFAAGAAQSDDITILALRRPTAPA